MMVGLCADNILNMDEVTKLNIHTAMQWTAYQIDNATMQRKLIKTR